MEFEKKCSLEELTLFGIGGFRFGLVFWYRDGLLERLYLNGNEINSINVKRQVFKTRDE